MLINIGRLLMLGIWLFLVYNLIVPFPKPLKYFLDLSFGFMVIMHGLKLLMLKATILPGQPKLTKLEQLRIFLFGVFELIAWQRKQNQRQS